jgi:hypothetical protein
MNQILFSHNYPKLWTQTKAILVDIRYIVNPNAMNDKLKEYDTFWKEEDGTCGYYELPKGLLLQLFFIGNDNIPFSTMRRHTPEKEMYYRRMIGTWFNVVVDSKVIKVFDET